MTTDERRRHRLLGVAFSLLVAVTPAACGETPADEHVVDEPVSIEYVEGSDIAHISLTEQAVNRLDIRTAPVVEAAEFTTVPGGALIIDPDGALWVYRKTGPRTFVRESINVDHEEGEFAFLTEGPPVGTEVVTVGAAQLYGIEFGIGH